MRDVVAGRVRVPRRVAGGCRLVAYLGLRRGDKGRPAWAPPTGTTQAASQPPVALRFI